MPKTSLLIFMLCFFLLTLNAAAQPIIQRNPTTRFAVIGDYGDNSTRAAEVAALVNRLAPDFVITTGDNNYPAGQAETIDANIGQYYSQYILHYQGSYGEGALGENRFFPALGNHDWQTGNIQAFTDYFILPNNERYYDFSWGPAHLFALDSDPHEPDGYTPSSAQARWLRDRLPLATEPWRIVYMHHPPFSSSEGYGTRSANWPYASWGASLVISGHAHNYERLDVEGTPYIVSGLAGAHVNNFDELDPNSQFRFNATHGALLVEATETTLTMNFYGIYGLPIASVNASQRAGELLKFDLTPAVQGEGTYNFVLESTLNNNLAFNALEAGENTPLLLVAVEGSNEPLRFAPIADATVDSTRPDRLFGESTVIELIRTRGEHRRIYLQFQVSGTSAPIVKMELRLYVHSIEVGTQGGIAVYLADSSPWTDEAVNWNTAPMLLVNDTPIESFTLQR